MHPGNHVKLITMVQMDECLPFKAREYKIKTK